MNRSRRVHLRDSGTNFSNVTICGLTLPASYRDRLTSEIKLVNCPKCQKKHEQRRARSE